MRKCLIAAASALVLAAAAACGSSSSSVSSPSNAGGLSFDQIMNLNTPDADAKLYTCAKQEGRVNLYTSVSAADPNYVKGFQAAYPGVSLKVYLEVSGLAARVQQEAAANKNTFDTLVDISGNIPRDDTYFTKFTSANAANIRSGLSSPYFVGTSGAVLTVAYNPTLVDPKLITSDWHSLLNPALAGKIYLSTDLGTAPLIGLLKWKYGTDFLKQLAKNVRVSGGNGHAVAQQVVNGTVPITLNAGTGYFKLFSAQSTSYRIQVMDPALGLFQTASISKHAPHPCAAKLLVDWLTSTSANGGVAVTTGKLGLPSPIQGSPWSPYAIPSTPPAEQWNVVPNSDPRLIAGYKSYADALADWTSIFQQTFVTK